MAETAGIELWYSEIAREAPDALSADYGIGRTKEEASRFARHRAEHLPWERFQNVTVRDDLCGASVVEDLICWLDPQNDIAKLIIDLHKSGKDVESVKAYFAAIDSQVNLFFPPIRVDRA